MEDVSKKWICPKLMGEGEVTQTFAKRIKKGRSSRDGRGDYEIRTS